MTDELRSRVLALCDETRQAMHNDRERAGRCAVEAERLSRGWRKSRERAEALRMLGHVRYLTGKHRAAAVAYAKAISMLCELGEEVDVARTRMSALQALIYLGRYEQALQWAAEARDVFVRQGDTLRAGRLETNLGNVYYRQDRFAEALSCYSRALRVFEGVGTPDDRAFALHNVAVCYMALLRFEEALQSYESALALSRQHLLTHVAFEAECNIAYLKYLAGEYTQAMELYRNAQRLPAAAGNPYREALSELEQSDLCLELNLWSDAREHALKAASGFEKQKVLYECGKAYLNLGALESRRGAVREARAAFRKARHRFRRDGNRYWQAVTDMQEAAMLADSGETSAARSLATQSLAVLRKSSLSDQAAWCGLLLARIDLLEGSLETAAAAARRIGSQAVLPALRYRALLLASQAEEAAGNDRAAGDTYREAASVVESLRAGIGADRVRVAFGADKAAVFEGLFRSCRGDAIAALDVAERAKSRALAELMAAGSATGETAEGAALRQEINRYYRLLDQPSERPTGDRAAELERRVAEAEHRYTRASAAAALGSPIAGERAESRLSSLPDGTTLLEYYDAGGLLYAFVGRQACLELIPLGEAAAVKRAFSMLQFQLSRARMAGPGELPPCSSVEPHLRELHRLLLGPVAPLLSAADLLIVPHGFLHYVPFHALAGDEGALADRVRTTYAPSLSVFARCRERSAVGEGGLVLGAADADAPHIEREVREVATRWPNARVFRGADATLERLREHGPTAGWIHIASHGVFRADNPMFSALRLGGSRVFVHDLSSLKLQCELVTLSGCGTGLNAVTGGEELLGMARGLLQAGARSIHASLWDVHDESAARYMSLFYGYALNGCRKDEAARRAMQEVRNEYPHPYYWAPFLIVGEGAGRISSPISNAGPAGSLKAGS